MHKLEFVLDNQRDEILWDLEILTDELLPAGKPGFSVN